MISTGDLKRGMTVELDGDLWNILEYHHIKIGRGSAQVRLKIRNLKSGSTVERTFQSGEKFRRAIIDRKPVQYLYREGDTYYFMDTETYEQIHMSADALGDSVGFLKPEMTIRVEFYGSQAVGIELPQTVDLKVVETVPGIKGATATNQMKPATLETGVVVQVPPFIDEGDVIRVNTDTGEYLARA